MPFPLSPGRTRYFLAASVLCLAALAGCSDDNGGSSSSPSPTPTAQPSTPPASPSGTAPGSPSPSSAQAKITIQNFAFRPAALTVAPGTRVTVANMDTTTHTVTAGSTFNTGDVAAGKTTSFTAPSTAGSYPYDCTIHPFMKGTLTVR